MSIILVNISFTYWVMQLIRPIKLSSSSVIGFTFLSALQIYLLKAGIDCHDSAGVSALNYE